MSDLSKLREGWESIEREDMRLLHTMTSQESLNQWLQLQMAFEWQLQQTAPLFEVQRRAALIALQARLQRLVTG